MRLVRFAFILLSISFASPVFAKMVAKSVDWNFDGIAFQSVLVYDDAVGAKRPGLVMVPNWYGINDTAVAKAKMIA